MHEPKTVTCSSSVIVAFAVCAVYIVRSSANAEGPRDALSVEIFSCCKTVRKITFEKIWNRWRSSKMARFDRL